MGELKNLAAEKPMVPMEPKSVVVSWRQPKDKWNMINQIVCAIYRYGHYFVKLEDIEEISYDSVNPEDWPTVITAKYVFVWDRKYNRYVKNERKYSSLELNYIINDAFAASKAIDAMKNFGGVISSIMEVPNMEIKKVIFNDPATIVYWGDDTKTIVKCQKGDTFSKETGLAMAIAKKALGNEGNFNDIFRKWVD